MFTHVLTFIIFNYHKIVNLQFMKISCSCLYGAITDIKATQPFQYKQEERKRKIHERDFD